MEQYFVCSTVKKSHQHFMHKCQHKQFEFDQPCAFSQEKKTTIANVQKRNVFLFEAL